MMSRRFHDQFSGQPNKMQISRVKLKAPRKKKLVKHNNYIYSFSSAIHIEKHVSCVKLIIFNLFLFTQRKFSRNFFRCRHDKNAALVTFLFCGFCGALLMSFPGVFRGGVRGIKCNRCGEYSFFP